ncbi:MAG: chromate transporter [Clostridiales bacterium]|nr:chromate transporter [Clostridiales bacterium]
MKELIDLYTTFFRIGLFTFGGGMAMLPMLTKEVVEDKKWATNEEILDYFAIGQCTPGIIAINTSTFIGTKRKGAIGGVTATLGMVTPSVIVILIIASILSQIMEYEIVGHIFAGIRIAVAALVTESLVGILKSGIKDIFGLVFYLIILTFCIFVTNSPILVVIAGIAVGICRIKLVDKNDKKEGKRNV